MVATVILLIIGAIAIIKGLKILERVEKYTVSLNLGMIGALLLALIIYSANLFFTGTWQLSNMEVNFDFKNLRVVLGLLIVVQGFEISRYLGSTYEKPQRIASMRPAQIISSIIYILFISLSTVLFKKDHGADITAIIKMVTPIALVLPFVLSITAIFSQFSAAVADTEGSNGLLRQ